MMPSAKPATAAADGKWHTPYTTREQAVAAAAAFSDAALLPESSSDEDGEVKLAAAAVAFTTGEATVGQSQRRPVVRARRRGTKGKRQTASGASITAIAPAAPAAPAEESQSQQRQGDPEWQSSSSVEGNEPAGLMKTADAAVLAKRTMAKSGTLLKQHPNDFSFSGAGFYKCIDIAGVAERAEPNQTSARRTVDTPRFGDVREAVALVDGINRGGKAMQYV